jgi:hypothetical protein
MRREAGTADQAGVRIEDSRSGKRFTPSIFNININIFDNLQSAICNLHLQFAMVNSGAAAHWPVLGFSW